LASRDSTRLAQLDHALQFTVGGAVGLSAWWYVTIRHMVTAGMNQTPGIQVSDATV